MDPPPAEDAGEIIARVLSAGNVYAVLEVQDDLSLGAGLSKKKVKDNFVRLARVIHPDKCSAEGAPLAFSRLRAAYEEVSADLGSPRAAFGPAPEPSQGYSPRAEGGKQRRQVASLTSRMLRGAALQEGADTGPTDLSALRRYIAHPSGARPPFIVSPGGGIGRRPFGGTERSDLGSGSSQAATTALDKGALSSATSPDDLLQQLSPMVPSARAGNVTADVSQFVKMRQEPLSAAGLSGSPGSSGFSEANTPLSESPMSMSSPHSAVLSDRGENALRPPDLTI